MPFLVNSNHKQYTFGFFGPFASPLRRPLANQEFDHILCFLGLQDLARCEKVCFNWFKFIQLTDQWKKQCQTQLGISSKTDPNRYLPRCQSYKKSIQLVFSRILDKNIYETYLRAKVSCPPRIPESISLKNWQNSDPCDPTTTIGKEYFWMYCPSHVEITIPENSSVVLDKVDDPNDPDAPRLIQKKVGFTHSLGKMLGLKVQSQIKVLKVPVTINNLVELLKLAKRESLYSYIWPNILEQHGNKRMSEGWVCMRRNVIGRNLSFAEQQALASGLTIPDLLSRIWFNVFERVLSCGKNLGPNRQDLDTYARTSTLTRDSQGIYCSTGCEINDFSRQSVYCENFDCDDVGIAVTLPT